LTWCTFDGERLDWCGGNYSHPWKYCVVANDWPQQNVTEWLFTTDIAPNTQLWPGLPAICACPGNPNAAYYIREEIFPVPRYQPPCDEEHGLVAFYMFMVVVFLIIFVWALLELIMWILMFAVKEKQCNILGGFLPKVFVLLTTILTTMDIWVILAGAGETVPWQFGAYWIWIFDAMCLVSAYLWWLVVFVDVVIKTKEMSRETSTFVSVSKWAVVLLVLACVSGFCITMGISYNFAIRITAEPNFQEKAKLIPSFTNARKANIVLGCLMITFSLIYGTILSLYSSYLISKGSESGMDAWRTMKTKTAWNIFATTAWLLVLATLITYACYVSWHIVEISVYQTQMAFMWIWIIQIFFAACVLIGITFALKTKFAKGENYCTSICRNAKTIESSRTSHGSSKRSGGSMKAGQTKGSNASVA